MTRRAVVTTGLAAVAALAGTAFVGTAAHATMPPGYVHAVVICQTATLYTGFNPGLHGTTAGDTGYTLPAGNKVAVQTEAPVFNGWLDTLDIGPSTTGWMRTECIGGYGSW
jgi:hypothetical protein